VAGHRKIHHNRGCSTFRMDGLGHTWLRGRRRWSGLTGSHHGLVPTQVAYNPYHWPARYLRNTTGVPACISQRRLVSARHRGVPHSHPVRHRRTGSHLALARNFAQPLILWDMETTGCGVGVGVTPKTTASEVASVFGLPKRSPRPLSLRISPKGNGVRHLHGHQRSLERRVALAYVGAGERCGEQTGERCTYRVGTPWSPARVRR
jgi:hypothetical protein